jgi:glycosyltransferase involved in cell wall biosynthesis
MNLINLLVVTRRFSIQGILNTTFFDNTTASSQQSSTLSQLIPSFSSSYAELERSNVAIYIDSLRGYGADHILLNLAIGLAKRGVKVDLLLADGSSKSSLPSIPSFRTIDFKSSRYSPIRNILKLKQYLTKCEPDILLSSIHFNNIVAASALVLSGASSKLILRQANTLNEQFKDYPLLIGFLIRVLTKLAYKRADLVLAQCKGMLNDLTDFMSVDPQKIKVIYNPTLTSDIYYKAQEAVYHRWLEAKDGPIILAAGRLKPQKDFATLLKAFAFVRQNVQNAKLLILGEGPQRRTLESIAVALGIENDVDLAGFKENPYPYISSADVFVSSSRYEGLPNILIEALALGKKIVATSCQGGTAEVLKYGKYGMLVPVGSPYQMGEAILQSLTQPSASHLHTEALEDFLQDSQVEEYVSIFFSLLDISGRERWVAPEPLSFLSSQNSSPLNAHREVA